MEKQKAVLTLIISTCKKYDDLWDANLLLLERNWGERGIKTLLVTDEETDRHYEGVEIVAAGAGMEITQRLQAAMERITTEYVLFSLDDYFLTEPINNAALCADVEFMARNCVDYLRLFPLSKHVIRSYKLVQATDHKGIFFYNERCDGYVISLYPGIWRTDFMKKTLTQTRNAWQYEVALTQMAKELNAVCTVSNNREFPFLDVIRKGKLLRKAARYFKKHPIYQTTRETMRARDEWALTIRTTLRHWLPKPLFRALKKRMIKRGHTFYSPL